jgi:hypothetical protein
MAGRAPASWEQRSRPDWMVGDARPELDEGSRAPAWMQVRTDTSWTRGRSRSDDGVLRRRNAGQRWQHGRERKEGQEGVPEGSRLTRKDVGVLDGDEADRAEERRGGIGDRDVQEMEAAEHLLLMRASGRATRQQEPSKGVACSRVAAGMGVGKRLGLQGRFYRVAEDILGRPIQQECYVEVGDCCRTSLGR